MLELRKLLQEFHWPATLPNQRLEIHTRRLFPPGDCTPNPFPESPFAGVLCNPMVWMLANIVSEAMLCGAFCGIRQACAVAITVVTFHMQGGPLDTAPSGPVVLLGAGRRLSHRLDRVMVCSAMLSSA